MRSRWSAAGGDAGKPVAIKTPALLLGEDQARDASEPDTVDDARIGGVGDDHFVSGIDGAEEDVKRF